MDEDDDDNNWDYIPDFPWALFAILILLCIAIFG